MTQLLDTNILSYPIIAFSDEMATVYTTATDLTTSSRSQVKAGWFEGMLIVDSNAIAFNVERARKVGDAGIAWLGIFPVRMVKVGLLVKEDRNCISTEKVRRHIYNASFSWHELEAGGVDWDVREQIEQAQSVSELIQALL